MHKQKLKDLLIFFPIFDIIGSIIGLLLIFTPESAVKVIIRIIGLALLIYAVYRTALLVRFYRRDAVFFLLILTQTILLLVGTVLAINPDGTLRLLAATVGAYMVANGALSLYRAAGTPVGGRKIATALAAVAGIILGFVLLFHPDGTLRLSAVLIGASLLVNSIRNIFSRTKAWRAERQQKGEEYIEAEFVDKSDEL